MTDESERRIIDSPGEPLARRSSLLRIASGSDEQADKLSGIALAGSADIGKWLFASLLTINGAGAALVVSKDGLSSTVALALFGIGIVLAVLSGMLFWLSLLLLGLSRYVPQTDSTYEKTIAYCAIFGAGGWLLSLCCFFVGGEVLL